MELIKKGIGMTSLDIAELTGKQHSHVIRDIKVEIGVLGQEIGESIFGLGSYLDKNNQSRTMFNLTEDGVMQLALKYDAISRYKCIQELKRLKELENKINTPRTFIEAMQLATETLIKNEQLELENKVKNQQILEMQPKVNYHDLILQCTELLTITLIAKDYGVSGKKMNELLHEYKVQYKQSGVWLLYEKYAEFGYTQTKTISFVKSDGRDGAKVHTYWTQKGRLFLYDLLKNNGVLPNIEK